MPFGHAFGIPDKRLGDTDKQTHRQTDRQRDIQTGRQTDRRTERQTDRQADSHTDNRQTKLGFTYISVGIYRQAYTASPCCWFSIRSFSATVSKSDASVLVGPGPHRRNGPDLVELLSTLSVDTGDEP